MNNRKMVLVVVSALGCILLFAQQKRTASVSDLSGSDKANLNNADNLFDQGRQVFRFTTFDDQAFWGDALKLHQASEGADVGDVVSLAPNLQPLAYLLGGDQATVRKVLQSWGAGHCDAELALDGKAVRPDGKTSEVLIPPAFGLAGVNLSTGTGWGSVAYW